MRVTPEMIAARQLVNQLSGQATEADIPRLIAASALASGGVRAVAPALIQALPMVGQSVEGKNQRQMMYTLGALQHFNESMARATPEQAAVLRRTMQPFLNEVLRNTRTGSSARNSTTPVSAIAPPSPPGTESLTSDELDEAIQIITSSKDLAVGDQKIPAANVAKRRLEARFPGRANQILATLKSNPARTGLAKVWADSTPSPESRRLVDRAMGGMPR